MAFIRKFLSAMSCMKNGVRFQNETQRIHRKEVYHRDWTPMDDLEKCRSTYTHNPIEDTL